MFGQNIESNKSRTALQTTQKKLISTTYIVLNIGINICPMYTFLDEYLIKSNPVLFNSIEPKTENV